MCFLFRPEPSLALGAVAISSGNSGNSTASWLIPLVICFVITLCLLATAMLFYVKCYAGGGTHGRRRLPKTANFPINIPNSCTRTGHQFMSSFATKKKNYHEKKVKKGSSQRQQHQQTSINNMQQQHCLDRDLNLNHHSAVVNHRFTTELERRVVTGESFPRAEFQLLPTTTSSESNFAGSSDIQRTRSTLDQKDIELQRELVGGGGCGVKRLSHRYGMKETDAL